MRRIDELHLDYPFAGSRMLQTFLAREGYEVGRLHVATLMKRMGIEAIYRQPNTSKPAPGHTIFPYLLRKLPVTRPNQVWAMDITYIPMARGFVYLAAVEPSNTRRCTYGPTPMSRRHGPPSHTRIAEEIHEGRVAARILENTGYAAGIY